MGRESLAAENQASLHTREQGAVLRGEPRLDVNRNQAGRELFPGRLHLNGYYTYRSMECAHGGVMKYNSNESLISILPGSLMATG
jgi:hypothetical protein